MVCPPLGQTNKLSVQFKTSHVYSSLKVKCILLILYFEDPFVLLVVAGQFGGKACDWSIARTRDWSLHGGGRPETPPPPHRNVTTSWERGHSPRTRDCPRSFIFGHRILYCLILPKPPTDRGLRIKFFTNFEMKTGGNVMTMFQGTSLEGGPLGKPRELFLKGYTPSFTNA